MAWMNRYQKSEYERLCKEEAARAVERHNAEVAQASEKWKAREWTPVGDPKAGVECFLLHDGRLIRVDGKTIFIPGTYPGHPQHQSYGFW